MIQIRNLASTQESANCIASFLDNQHIANLVFSYLKAKELGTCLSACKQWNQYANNEALWNDLVPAMAFGPRQWKLYFGDVGIAPPLPRRIHQILNAPCPIWPGKRVHETHLLTLIPKTVNGKLLTLKSLGELVKNPLQGPATQYRYFSIGQYIDQPTRVSHWTLLSRNVIPGSRNKSYASQQKLVKKYRDYEVPNILDATVAIFIEHARTGNRLPPNNLRIFTQCQEKYSRNRHLVVGGFVTDQLRIYLYSDPLEIDGVGVQRKFYGEKK